MRTIVTNTTAYSFDELSKEAQEKAINHHRHDSVEWDWYEFAYEDFKEELKKMGIECEGFYFSLERSRYLFMNKPVIADEDHFNRATGFSITDEDCVNIMTKHKGGGSAVHYVVMGDYEDYNEELTKWVNKLMETFWKRLDKEYDYLISDESVKDNIIANELEFDKEGKSI